MTDDDQRHALILCMTAHETIKKRRALEEICGYPAEYGGDELLLHQLDEFLVRPLVVKLLRQAVQDTIKAATGDGVALLVEQVRKSVDGQNTKTPDVPEVREP